MIEINLEDHERWLLRRKAELGLEGHGYVPINNGSRRTEAKRQALRGLREHARAQGREPRFYAMIGDGTD